MLAYFKNKRIGKVIKTEYNHQLKIEICFVLVDCSNKITKIRKPKPDSNWKIVDC